SGRTNRFAGMLAAFGLFGLFFVVFLKANLSVLPAAQMPGGESGSLRAVGISLMTDNLLPFEVAGILLLVALIGAAYIAGNRLPPVRTGSPQNSRFGRPQGGEEKNTHLQEDGGESNPF
nr:NADH-quinone oxidoreductase subunit J [Cytophagales bacterium]